MLNEIPLCEWKETENHGRSVDFVFRYQAVGTQKMCQFALSNFCAVGACRKIFDTNAI